MSSKEIRDLIFKEISTPSSNRILYIAQAFRIGMSMDEVFSLCFIDRWFLSQIKELVDSELKLKDKSLESISESLRELKSDGFSDKRLASILDTSESEVRDLKGRKSIRPVFKRIDTCAAEFESSTAYMYSTYSDFCESLSYKK